MATTGIKITTFCKLFSYILFRLKNNFVLILILRTLNLVKKMNLTKKHSLNVLRKRLRVENF